MQPFPSGRPPSRADAPQRVARRHARRGGRNVPRLAPPIGKVAQSTQHLGAPLDPTTRKTPIRPAATHTLCWLLVVCVGMLLLPLASARAAGTDRGSPGTRRDAERRLDKAARALTQGTLAEAKQALKELEKRRGDRRVAHLIADALLSGVPEGLLENGLASLGTLGDPSVVEALTVFAGHRRVSARLAALQALVAVRAPGLVGHLEAALRDSDPRVRAYGARALGTWLAATQGSESARRTAPDPGRRLEDARAATEVLLAALARGVAEAAVAIGKLGSADAIPQYGRLLERAPLAVMLAGYKAFLVRKDLPAAAKVSIIVRLEEVASPPVKRFLQAHLVSTDFRREPEVKRSIEEAVKRIAGPDPEQQSPHGPAPKVNP